MVPHSPASPATPTLKFMLVHSDVTNYHFSWVHSGAVVLHTTSQQMAFIKAAAGSWREHGRNLVHCGRLETPGGGRQRDEVEDITFIK